MPRLKTDWVVIATSGPTVDGRNIEPVWLTDAAACYNRDELTAMIWPYHDSPGYRAYGVNYGEVDELKTEKFGDKIQLKARLIPNAFLLECNKREQRLFTSIEISENYLGSNKFFLSGLAVTDTPASFNTTRLQFSQGDEKLFHGSTEDLNFSLIDEHSARESYFSRLFKKSSEKVESKMNEEQFNKLSSSLDALNGRIDAMDAKIKAFGQKDDNPDAPPPAAGNEPEGTPPAAGNQPAPTEQFSFDKAASDKLFSTLDALKQKVEGLDAKFSALKTDATPLPGGNPAGGEKLELV
ncbi:MAG: GPO family capsid scaffolding protein [Plesiomonas shigelloides]